MAQKPIPVGSETKSKVTVFSGPQERFRSSSKAMAAHVEMVDGEAFNRGADAALSQFSVDLADEAVDLNSAASVGFRLRGAADFLARFKTLAEMPKERTPQSSAGILKSTEPFRRP